MHAVCICTIKRPTSLWSSCRSFWCHTNVLLLLLQEPTQAELDPEMQALVVSRETLPGGEAINQGRIARGFKPLHLVVVGLIGGRDAGDKLSSTALRDNDAAAVGQQ